jgi:hypothetical protein
MAIDGIVSELAKLMVLAKRNPEILQFNPWYFWEGYVGVAIKEDGERRWIIVAPAKDLTSIFGIVADLIGSVEGLVRAQLRVDSIPGMDIRVQGLLAEMDEHLGIIQGSGGLETLERAVAAKLAEEIEVEALFEG